MPPTSIDRDRCQYRDFKRCQWHCETKTCSFICNEGWPDLDECPRDAKNHPCDEQHPCPLDDKETR
jgi:hypothetical protein